jgi:hypothetical protein
MKNIKYGSTITKCHEASNRKLFIRYMLYSPCGNFMYVNYCVYLTTILIFVIHLL